MLGKLFGKKSKPANEEQWSLATAQDGDMQLIFRIRTVPAELNRADYSQMVAVSWPYEPAVGGMPSPADKARMDQLEDLLMPALENAGNAILMVVVTGNGVREWQWYSRSRDETMQHVNSALAGQDRFPVEFSFQDDPNWQAYSQFEA